MAIYCFAERRRELFTEICVRGWVAAARDFPQHKNREEATELAYQECDALRSEVCCIPANGTYELLVVSAYCESYRAFEDLTDRQRAIFAYEFKTVAVEEALEMVRPGFDAMRTYLDGVYARFVEASEIV